MKMIFCITIVVFSLSGCQLQKSLDSKQLDLSGTYKQKGSSERLKLKSDGTYLLFKAPVTFTPVIEQCEVASKGKWSVIAENVIEITSENYYMQQKGFEYELKRESKYSEDSLYIQINLPDDFYTIKFRFDFNYNNNKSVITNETSIVLSKSEHLWNRRTGTNHIKFSLNADASGTILYKSRILFEIFATDIDTEKYNSLTITMPYFDRCFFEFEPYKQDLIYNKSKNQLLWQGEIWER